MAEKRTTPAPLPPRTARRERILATALGLARRGGFDAVQMREVAEGADVALGTLYRYFPSKVHLLVSALGDELERLSARAQRRAALEGSRADRVVAVLAQATRSMQKDQLLTEAVVRATMAADASVAAEVGAVRRQMSSLIVEAMRSGGEQTPDDEALALVLQDVWFARMISWLGGRLDGDALQRDVEAAVRLVLRT